MKETKAKRYKTEWNFHSNKLGLALEDHGGNCKNYIQYGHMRGAEWGMSRFQAIKTLKPWAAKEIVDLQRKIKEYERFLRYLDKLNKEAK